jgi:hypothetical protein
MKMIIDQRQISINSSPEKIFDFIERMPNKFPVYKLLETKPFFFIRILLVDGLRAALNAISVVRSDDALILQVGDTMGPFTLSESEKPRKYWFTLKSFFFDCRTGYSLKAIDGKTTLGFDLIAEDPSLMEKVWWFLFKPLHGILARKALRIIKEHVENQDDQIISNMNGHYA